MNAPAGLVVRQVGRQWIGILRCGAGTPEQAREMADGYMERRGIACAWTKTAGGQRLKVGVMGLRRFDVYYQLEARP